MVWSRRQASVLQGMLGERCKAAGLPADHVRVELAMRYGTPSIASGLEALKSAGCDRILLYPLYPQYASATTATACDEAFRQLRPLSLAARRARHRLLPRRSRLHPRMAARINDYWMRHRRPDKLRVVVPRRAALFARSRRPLSLPVPEDGAPAAQRARARRRSEVIVTFQSRFGRTEWLKPYTPRCCATLGKEGTGRVDMFCPGFVADCLETLEEIAIEGKHDVRRGRRRRAELHSGAQRSSGVVRGDGRDRVEASAGVAGCTGVAQSDARPSARARGDDGRAVRDSR